MIAPGTSAPDFTLQDQLGRRFSLRAQLAQRRNVLLLFYPLDWTPTCSQEVPELDALAPRFLEEANTVVASISADSRFCHAAWGASRGGVEMPMLADVAPHGGVARAYGAWIPAEDIPDRATVIIDPRGVVRYAVSVGKDGRRDMNQLLAIATQINGGAPGAPGTPRQAAPGGKPTLYLSTHCGHCQHVVQAIENMHAASKVRILWVDSNPSARRALEGMMKRPGTPALATPDGRVLAGSPDIISYLATL